MPVKIENLDGLKRRLTISVPAEEVDEAYRAQLQVESKTVKIPRFRAGKVPLKEVERRFGKEIRQKVANELIQSGMRNAISEHKVQIAGMPQIEPFELVVGKPLEVIVHYETYPEIQLSEIKGEHLERPRAEVTSDDIAKVLESLQQQHAEWEEVTRAAEEGDRVIIDFEGTQDGEPFDQGSAKDFQVELGSNRMIPGFEEGIVGMKSSEQRDIKVTFPKEYPHATLAGSEAMFKITVHKIMAANLPPLDDALAEKLGFKEGGLEALKADIRKNMEQELERVLSAELKMNLLDKLIELNPIEVPNALIEAEIDHLQQLTRQQMAQSRSPDEAKKADLPREPYLEQAKKRVILGLLLSEVIKQEQIKASPDQVRAKIEEIASSYQKPEEVIAWYYNNKGMLAEIESAVLEDQAVTKLLEQFEVDDKEITCEEALKKRSQH